MKNCLFTGKTVLITAGATREPIDDVRFVTNQNNASVGYDLANYMLQQGSRVFLVSGQVKIGFTHPMLTVVTVNTGHEMYLAACQFFEEADIVFFSAAVADYRPVALPRKTYPKQEDSFTLKMVKNIDIAGAFAKVKRFNQVTVGVASSENTLQQVVAKIDQKNFDLMVLNNFSDSELEDSVDLNSISLVRKDHSVEQLGVLPAVLIAKEVALAIAALLMLKQPTAVYLSHTSKSINQQLQA